METTVLRTGLTPFRGANKVSEAVPEPRLDIGGHGFVRVARGHYQSHLERSY